MEVKMETNMLKAQQLSKERLSENLYFALH